MNIVTPNEQVEATSIVEQTNTTFLDETPMNVAKPHAYKETPINIPRSDMGEDKWSVHEMLAKPFRVSAGQWTTTQLPATLINILPSIATPNIINDILENNIESMQTNIIKSYTFLRYKAVFTLQLNSTKFYNGRLVLGYIPLATLAPDNITITMLTMYPSIVIDAGNAEPVQLEVPWFHPMSSFNQTVNLISQNSLGVLYLSPLTMLRAPSSAATFVDFTIYMHLEDVEFHVPINPALTFLSPTLSENKIRQLLEQLKRQGYELNEAHGLFDGVGSLFSKVKDTVSGAASGLGKVFEGDFEGAFDDLGGALDTGLTALAEGAEIGMEVGLFDRPYDPKYERARQPVTSSFAFGCGPDSVHKLDISPFSMYKPNGNITGRSVSRDMDILEQAQRESVLQVFQWTTTNSVGSLLYLSSIYPTNFFTNVYPTWIKTFSDQGIYWTGSIVFTISVVATHFHAGRLMVVYSNGNSPSPTLAMDECTNWPFVTVDLHNTDNREYELELPYNQVMPFLYNAGSINTAATPDSSTLRSAGSLLIFVQNQLEAPETVATTVDVIVKVRAGKDFRIWGLRNTEFTGKTWASVAYWNTLSSEVAPQLVKQAPTVQQGPGRVFNVAHSGDLDIRKEIALVHADVESMILKMTEMRSRITDLRIAWKSESDDTKSVAGLLSNVANNVNKALNGFNNSSSVLIDLEEILSKPLCNEAHAGAVENVEEHSDAVQPVLQKGRQLATHSLNHAAFTLTTDLRDQLRRYMFLNSIIIEPSQPNSDRIWKIPVMPGGGTPGTNLLNYFDASYAGWSGGLRFKFVFNSSNLDGKVFSVVHRPTVYPQGGIISPGVYSGSLVAGIARGVGDGYAFYTCNLIDERIISVEVPYLQPFHFMRTFNSEVATIFNQCSNGILEIRVEDMRMFAQNPLAMTAQPVEPQNVVTCDIYVAAADDFAFHFPIPNILGAGGVGTVDYAQTNVPTPVIPDGRTSDSFVQL